MKLFGFNIGREKKSLTAISVSDIIRSRMVGLVKNKLTITPRQAITYYTSVSVVAKAVDMLAKEIASIKPWLYNMSTEEFEESPIDQLLSSPNPDKTRYELIQAFASYFLTVGDSFLMALGNIKKPPTELDTAHPSFIQIINSDKDQYVQKYKFASTDKTYINFNRTPVKGKYRYYNEEDRELWHMRTFNPLPEKQNTGLSPLDVIYYEVEQHLHSSRHNLSTLQKGARLSGILSIQEELDDSQRARLREKVNGEWSGADNAGNIALIDGSKAEFSEFSKSMKDMDFLELKKEVTAIVYNVYSIPLPLIFTDTMTLNNYKEAKFALYDMAVLPIVARMYEELSLFLLPRYGYDTSKYKLWYDDSDIPALELRRSEEIKRKKESGVYTVNELRSLYGLDPIPNGDTLYQPVNLVPLGSSPITNPSQAPEPTIKDKFREILSKQIDKNTGLRKYTNEDIEKIASERGIGNE